MTRQQEAEILNLTRKLKLGSRASDGIKSVLGKMPINMSESRAIRVIDELTERYAPIAAAEKAAFARELCEQDVFGGF